VLAVVSPCTCGAGPLFDRVRVAMAHEPSVDRHHRVGRKNLRSAISIGPIAIDSRCPVGVEAFCDSISRVGGLQSGKEQDAPSSQTIRGRSGGAPGVCCKPFVRQPSRSA
jgi:hypothetical protein